MPLKSATQMDPIESINPVGDSSFALMLEAQARGHENFYYVPDTLALSDGVLSALVAPVEVFDKPKGEHFKLGSAARCDLSEFDVVHLRQDPPFDMHYITSTHLLERIHPKTLVVNDPVSVRNAPEKILVTEFPDLMPPTLITRDRGEISRFPQAARQHHRQAALWQWRRRSVLHHRRRPEPRFADRTVRTKLPRTLHRAEIPARRQKGRQAHHPG